MSVSKGPFVEYFTFVVVQYGGEHGHHVISKVKVIMGHAFDMINTIKRNRKLRKNHKKKPVVGRTSQLINGDGLEVRRSRRDKENGLLLKWMIVIVVLVVLSVWLIGGR